MVTESWYTDTSVPSISGYNLYRKDRKDRIGGGVCVYVCESISSLEVCSPNLCSNKVEVVWCELRCGPSDRVLVGCL